MNLLFSNETEIDISEKILNLINLVIIQTLKSEDFSQNVEISYTVVNNEEIKSLNKKYRNIEKETDVLSFPLLSFPIQNTNKDKTTNLGDIVVSIEKALEQAQNYNHSLERELSFLTVHSMLHLLGYDHITKEEEEIMFKKQENILNILNIKR